MFCGLFRLFRSEVDLFIDLGNRFKQCDLECNEYNLIIELLWMISKQNSHKQI